MDGVWMIEERERVALPLFFLATQEENNVRKESGVLFPITSDWKGEARERNSRRR